MSVTIVEAPEARVEAPWCLNLLIANEMVAGKGEPLTVENPATEEILAAPRQATLDQVDQAVKAARAAFETGVWRDPLERQRLLYRLADLLEERTAQFRTALVEEIGTPVSLCEPMQLGGAIKNLRYAARMATTDWTSHIGRDAGPPVSESILRHEPVGVVAAISAYNYPILIGLGKIGAAMSVGCTTVLLPSPQTPLATLMLGELIVEAGFPAGVVNIVLGGADVGRALTSHKDIDKVTFTGSASVGREVLLQASANLKGAVLELGGKSAAIVLPDTDLSKVVLPLHGRYLRNAGQGCQSPTRILVPKSQYDDFIDLSRDAFTKIKVGDPWDPETTAGPLISSRHRDSVEGYVARALSTGARIAIGGGRPDMARGYYMNSTLISNVTNDAEISREELFGPVGVVMTYDTVDEAIAIANDSDYGLGGAVFGPLEEAKRVATRMRTGSVFVNGVGALRFDGGLHGWKNSGLGVEWGEEGLREFLHLQHIQWVVD